MISAVTGTTSATQWVQPIQTPTVNRNEASSSTSASFAQDSVNISANGRKMAQAFLESSSGKYNQ
jgi:hypothetical protein